MRRGDIEKRLDHYFHSPRFVIEAEKLEKCSYSLATISALSFQVTDGTHYTPNYVESGVPFISVKDIRDFQISFDNTKFVSKDEHEILAKRCNPQSGDVLLTKVGTIGMATIVPDNVEPFDLFVSVCLIKPNKALVDPEFLCSVLNTHTARNQFARQLKGIGVPDLHLENIREVLIPLPPLETQRELVSQLDAARQVRQKLLNDAEALLASLDGFLLEALDLKAPIVTDKPFYAVKIADARLRFDPQFHRPEFKSWIDAIKQIPSLRLGEVGDFSSETWEPILSDEATFNYIEISRVNTQTGEVTPQEIAVSEAPSRARMKVRSGDVIISLTRPHHGAIAVIGDDLSGAIASTGFAIMRDFGANLDRTYLWAILRSVLCKPQMIQRSSGGTYPAITQAELAQIYVPIPPLDVQQRIADELKARRQSAQELRAEAETTWDEAKARFEAALLA